MIKFSRNKSLFYFFTKDDTFSDRLLIFLFHFAFFLKKFKNTQSKEDLQDLFDYIFKELEISIREIGYGDASINKKMKVYVNSLYSILDKINDWENLESKKKNEIFESFFNVDKDANKLTNYFDKYFNFLKKKTFNSFLNGVINLKI